MQKIRHIFEFIYFYDMHIILDRRAFEYGLGQRGGLGFKKGENHCPSGPQVPWLRTTGLKVF